MASTMARSPSSKVTIADIARESDVSSATVSLVLRDKPGISQETRERVLETARALGYIPRTTQPVTPHAIETIGLLVKMRSNDLAAANSFYAPILAAIDEECRHRQIHLIYANLPVDECNAPLEFPQLLSQQKVDGLILVGVHLKRQYLSLLADAATPYILVDGYTDGILADSVVADNMTGMAEATRFLVRQGHRKIALVGSSPDAFPSIRERRAGYLHILAEEGLDPIFVDCALTEEAVDNAVKTFLEASPDVTALIGCNDVAAISILRTAQEAGYAIPDDLSIMGFDNIDITKHTTPSITTIHIDKMSMGRCATEMLLNRIAHPAAAHVRAVILPSLIKRQSVKTIMK